MFQLDWLNANDNTRHTTRQHDEANARRDFAILESGRRPETGEVLHRPAAWVALTRDEPRAARGYVTVMYRGGVEVPDRFRLADTSLTRT
jgi:hypothetical protein